jgi:succinate dehydrogenase/fumarate reductase-like Fe-S protein
VSTVRIHYHGHTYTVPGALTVLRALEHVGYRFVRNCGCRGGVCGACAFVYHVEGDHRLRGGLACQVKVEDGLHVAFVDAFPSLHALHPLAELPSGEAGVLSVYPEVLRCLGCGQCTQVCPQGLEVRHLVALVERGDLAGAAEGSMECIMCGVCASRCPVRIPQPHLFLLVRRLQGMRHTPLAPDLMRRVAEIEAGMYREELEELGRLSLEERRARLLKLLKDI